MSEITYNNLAWQRPGEGILRDHHLRMPQDEIDEEVRLAGYTWREMDDFTESYQAWAAEQALEDAENELQMELLALEEEEERILLTWDEMYALDIDRDWQLPKSEEKWYRNHYSEEALEWRAQRTDALCQDIANNLRRREEEAAKPKPQPQTKPVPVKTTVIRLADLPANVLKWKGELYQLKFPMLVERGTHRITCLTLWQVKNRLSDGFAFTEVPPTYSPQ
jgi:hypothetical protein